MGRKHLLVAVGVFQQVLDNLQQFVGLVCRDTVETEAAGFLTLPEEVLEEVVQHVAVAVELQETLRVLRFRGGALGEPSAFSPATTLISPVFSSRTISTSFSSFFFAI